MRTSIAGATFLLVGAGAFAVGAAPDLTGDNIALNGSDTIFEITQDVLVACPTSFPDFGTHGISYVGGGSGVGAGQMALNQQQVSPMSRALKNTEFCGVSLDLDNDPATAAVPVQGTTEDLMIALDGIAIMANQATSCAGNGVNQTGTIAVVDATGNPVVNCPGCTAGTSNYVLASSLDTLRLIYLGTGHDGTFDCNGAVRNSLVNSWGNLFAAGCTQTTCTQLKHAWRRSDLSGTTDAFLTAVGGVGARAIGSLPSVPAASRKQNPFCNSLDANPTSTRATAPGAPACTTQPLTSATCPNGTVCAAGQLCNAATNTCVSNACTTTGCPAGQVCRPDGQCVVTTCPSGTGGPYGATLGNTPANNTRACDGANGMCTLSFGGASDYSDLDPIRRTCDIAGNDQACEADGSYGLVQVILPPDTTTVTAADAYPTRFCDPGSFDLAVTGNANLACPGGPQFLGKCFQPFFLDNGVENFQCLSRRSARAFGTPSGTDGRVWNMQVKKLDSSFNPPRPAAYVRDANGRFMTQGMFRFHVTSAPTCQNPDATQQIGCLVNADSCSIGFAGREADQQTGNQALLVNGVQATDANITNLVTGGTPVYPLSRRLFFASLVGFSNLKGGESELAKCFSDNNITRQAVTNHFFVNLPAPGVQCLDYDETLGTGVTPLPGCASATNTDACRLTPPGAKADATVATSAFLMANPVAGSTRAQVQAILNANCISCHSGATPPQGLDLTNVGAVIGVAANESPKLRIAAGNANGSYLVDKIKGITVNADGTSGGALASGNRMPNGQPQLNPTDINAIVSWINGGAL